MKIIFLIALCLGTTAAAQKRPGPGSLAMGSAGISLKGLWSLQQNPAGIAGIASPGIAFAYERHFLDQEISSQIALFALPFAKNVLGFNIQRYGFTEYREQHAGIAYARKFGSSLSLSIGLNYHQLSISGYGSSTTFSAEAGFQFAINENLTLASHLANPGRSRFEDHPGSDIPVRLSFGAAYRFTDKLIVAGDVIKVLQSSADVRLGMEYSLIPAFSLRGGVSASPFKQYAGFGFHHKRLSLDAAVSSHPSLGYSPQIGLAYEF